LVNLPGRSLIQSEFNFLSSAIQWLKSAFQASMTMKNRTLHIVAHSLMILAWVILVCGVVVSIVVAIKAATPLAQVTFLLVGLILSFINTVFLIGASKLIHLLINVDYNLEQIRDSLKADN
jgi:lysylphosphatidylglycerol synthetase-like protein (DUF2156 family)